MKPVNVTGKVWPGVRYFCTTRQGGVSLAPFDTNNMGLHVGDDIDAVRENRKRLAEQLPEAPIWLNQVHGTDVFDADAAVAKNELTDSTDALLCSEGDYDASVTSEPGRVLAIMTADCLPVVFAGDNIVGAAHAGWRGLAAGVLENTVNKMQACSGKLPDYAWIGPGISCRAFEVGLPVREAFLDLAPALAEYFVPHPDNAGKWFADLSAIAAWRLSRLGIAHIEQSGLCTYRQNDLFYSYRRENVTGRMATVIWLEP